MRYNKNDDISLRRDMRYSPKDNLHPWLSLFTRSMLDYALDPDYAKDITIVNIGSVRSETIGLAEEFLELKADFKCERCFAERGFEKIFCAEYDRLYSEKTKSSKLPKAKFKFIPMRQYIDTYESMDTLSAYDEMCYTRREIRGADGKVCRTCPKCGHPEEKIETKEEIEAKIEKDGQRRATLNQHWTFDYDNPVWIHGNWRVVPTYPSKIEPYDNGVLNRPGPW